MAVIPNEIIIKTNNTKAFINIDDGSFRHSLTPSIQEGKQDGHKIEVMFNNGHVRVENYGSAMVIQCQNVGRSFANEKEKERANKRPWISLCEEVDGVIGTRNNFFYDGSIHHTKDDVKCGQAFVDLTIKKTSRNESYFSISFPVIPVKKRITHSSPSLPPPPLPTTNSGTEDTNTSEKTG